MKALVLEAYNKLIYTDVPEPNLKENEVLIQVKACGICGSDVHGMDGSTGRRIPPIIMGHEAAGIIVQTGSQAQQYAVGDRVTFDSTIYCGQCSFCRKGLINLCENRRVLGVSCSDYRQHGAFAEYVAVPEHILYCMPEGLSFEQAAMVEPCSIAVHATERTPHHLNASAVVVGVGMIGLFVIQVLRAAGFGTIFAVDIDDDKLKLAQQLGADLSFNSQKADIVSEIKQHTQGLGAQAAFDVVGLPATLQTALACIHKGGTLTLIGNLAPTVEFPLQSVVTREISIYGCCASQGEYPACLNMIARGQLNVDTLISAVVPLSQGAEWFWRIYHKEKGLMKVILVAE